jgi:hypothetical protein
MAQTVMVLMLYLEVYTVTVSAVSVQLAIGGLPRAVVMLLV